MRIQALGFIALFFVFGSACATQNTPPSDASLRELLQVMHAQKSLDYTRNQLDGMLHNSMHQDLAGQVIDGGLQKIIDTQTDKLNDLLLRKMTWASLEPMYVDIYRTTFTQKEVDDMLAFYRTPSGQSMITKMPIVMAQIMRSMQGWMAQLTPQIQKISSDTTSRIKAYEANKQSTSAPSPAGSTTGSK